MRRVRASFGVLGVTVLTVTALLLAPYLTMSSLPTESPAKIRTVQVETGCVEQMLAVAGRVRFEREYAAVSPVTGRIARVYVQPGDAVTAGQALFRLDGQAEEAALSAAFAAGAGVEESVVVSTSSGDVNVSGLDRLGASADQAAKEAVLRLSGMTVRAAADGRVQQVFVSELGGTLAGDPAVTLSGDKQRILCSMVVRDAEKVRIGQTARVISGGVTACMATVSGVGAAAVDASTGQTVSEIALTPERNLDLPLGAPVDVEIILCGRERVATLPLTALTAEQTVWWVTDGRCWELPVSVLLEDEVSCWVALPEGIRVVDAPDGLIEGQRVKEMKP